MKKILIAAAITMASGCVYYPVEPMREGQSMILMKKVSAEYLHKNRPVVIEHEVTGFGKYSKPNSAHTAAYVPAIEHYGTYMCEINDHPVGALNEKGMEKLESGYCYAPVLVGVSDPTELESTYMTIQSLNGNIPKAFQGTRCSIELQRVDCAWAMREAASYGEYKSPPVFIKE